MATAESSQKVVELGEKLYQTNLVVVNQDIRRMADEALKNGDADEALRIRDEHEFEQTLSHKLRASREIPRVLLDIQTQQSWITAAVSVVCNSDNVQQLLAVRGESGKLGLVRADLQGTEILGRGGFAVAYRASLEDGPRDAVLKVLDPKPENQPKNAKQKTDLEKRFRFEGELLQRAQGQGAPKFFDRDKQQGSNGRPLQEGQREDRNPEFILMERKPGVTLFQLCEALRRIGHWPPSPKLGRILMLLCTEAVAGLHSQDVVHRDVKPENIIIGDTGGASCIDLGLARRNNPDCTRNTFDQEADGRQRRRIMGTVRYMSPEQARGDYDIDHRSDYFSLGLIGYELLAGEPLIPVDEKTTRIGLGVGTSVDLRDKLRPLYRDRDRDFTHVVEFCLQERGFRPRSAQEILNGHKLDEIQVPALRSLTVMNDGERDVDLLSLWPKPQEQNLGEDAVSEWGRTPELAATNLAKALVDVYGKGDQNFGGPSPYAAMEKEAEKLRRQNKNLRWGIAGAAAIVLTGGGYLLWDWWRNRNKVPPLAAGPVDPGPKQPVVEQKPAVRAFKEARNTAGGPPHEVWYSDGKFEGLTLWGKDDQVRSVMKNYKSGHMLETSNGTAQFVRWELSEMQIQQFRQFMGRDSMVPPENPRLYALRMGDTVVAFVEGEGYVVLNTEKRTCQVFRTREDFYKYLSEAKLLEQLSGLQFGEAVYGPSNEPGRRPTVEGKEAQGIREDALRALDHIRTVPTLFVPESGAAAIGAGMVLGRPLPSMIADAERILREAGAAVPVATMALEELAKIPVDAIPAELVALSDQMKKTSLINKAQAVSIALHILHVIYELAKLYVSAQTGIPASAMPSPIIPSYVVP